MDITARHPPDLVYHKFMKASQGSLIVNWDLG